MKVKETRIKTIRTKSLRNTSHTPGTALEPQRVRTHLGDLCGMCLRELGAVAWLRTREYPLPVCQECMSQPAPRYN